MSGFALGRAPSTSGRSGRSAHSAHSGRSGRSARSASADGTHSEDVFMPTESLGNSLGNIDFTKLDDFIKEERIGDNNPYSPTFANDAPQFAAPRNPNPSLGFWDKLRGKKQQQTFTPRTPDSVHSLDINRFAFFSASSEETIHAQDLPSLVEPGNSIKHLFSEDSTWWLDCLCPTDAEFKVIAKTFGIHPLTAEDIRMQESREKVELFRHYYFVSFHTFEPDRESEDFLEPISFYAVVFAGGILSFHYYPVGHPGSVRRRIRLLRDHVQVSADWICYALIDDITDEYAPVIHGIEHEADAIEDQVLVARDADFGSTLLTIGYCRHKVMALLRLLSGKADVIKLFANRCLEEGVDKTRPRADIGLYLGDIQDHILTMFQNLHSYEKILSRAHSNYLAQLQVELFNSNNRMTAMFSKISLIGTIFIPLLIIPGLFGMNVLVPGKDVNTLAWFFGIIGVMALFIVVLYHFLSRWIRGVIRNSYTPVNGGVIHIGMKKIEGGVNKAKSILSGIGG